MTAEIKPAPIAVDCKAEPTLDELRRRVEDALETFSIDEVRQLVAEIENHLGGEE